MQNRILFALWYKNTVYSVKAENLLQKIKDHQTIKFAFFPKEIRCSNVLLCYSV